MNIAIVGENIFFASLNSSLLQLSFCKQIAEVNFTNVEAVFVFSDKTNTGNIPSNIAVFIDDCLGEVVTTQNQIKICGWNGFLEKPIWEVIGSPSAQQQSVLTALSKNYIVVPNQPGFVSARVITMIINEAFFALDDNVANPADIDIAMKLGTNYPQGPFEWATQIGYKPIVDLLQKLALTNSKYAPAKSLLAKLG
jgi:3-hydroxybutyryl-CoA dehydrogenase